MSALVIVALIIILLFVIFIVALFVSSMRTGKKDAEDPFTRKVMDSDGVYKKGYIKGRGYDGKEPKRFEYDSYDGNKLESEAQSGREDDAGGSGGREQMNIPKI